MSSSAPVEIGMHQQLANAPSNSSGEVGPGSATQTGTRIADDRRSPMRMGDSDSASPRAPTVPDGLGFL